MSKVTLVAFSLLLIGVYGLIFEFTAPGAVAPGVVGTICRLLGLYTLNMLPINGCNRRNKGRLYGLHSRTPLSK
jgi:membrane-bound ClpP family serine protease